MDTSALPESPGSLGSEIGAEKILKEMQQARPVPGFVSEQAFPDGEGEAAFVLLSLSGGPKT